MSRTAGFTLVEIVVVLLLIGLFSALALPMLTGFGEDQLALTSRRIAGTVQYLFNESALSGRPYRLTYNLDRRSWGAKRLETSGELVPVSGTGSERQLPSGVKFEDVVVVGRGKFSSGTVTTQILPIGWLQETIIHLQNKRGRQMTLRLMPFTGATEVYEGYRDFQTQQ